MKYGPTISDIRKAKKISLKNLLQDQMPPSSYSRFVDGKTETSVNNFVALLENLNVTFTSITVTKTAATTNSTAS